MNKTKNDIKKFLANFNSDYSSSKLNFIDDTAFMESLKNGKEIPFSKQNFPEIKETDQNYIKDMVFKEVKIAEAIIFTFLTNQMTSIRVCNENSLFLPKPEFDREMILNRTMNSWAQMKMNPWIMDLFKDDNPAMDKIYDDSEVSIKMSDNSLNLASILASTMTVKKDSSQFLFDSLREHSMNSGKFTELYLWDYSQESHLHRIKFSWNGKITNENLARLLKINSNESNNISNSNYKISLSSLLVSNFFRMFQEKDRDISSMFGVYHQEKTCFCQMLETMTGMSFWDPRISRMADLTIQEEAYLLTNFSDHSVYISQIGKIPLKKKNHISCTSFINSIKITLLSLSSPFLRVQSFLGEDSDREIYNFGIDDKVSKDCLQKNFNSEEIVKFLRANDMDMYNSLDYQHKKNFLTESSTSTDSKIFQDSNKDTSYSRSLLKELENSVISKCFTDYKKPDIKVLLLSNMSYDSFLSICFFIGKWRDMSSCFLESDFTMLEWKMVMAKDLFFNKFPNYGESNLSEDDKNLIWRLFKNNLKDLPMFQDKCFMWLYKTFISRMATYMLSYQKMDSSQDKFNEFYSKWKIDSDTKDQVKDNAFLTMYLEIYEEMVNDSKSEFMKLSLNRSEFMLTRENNKDLIDTSLSNLLFKMKF